MSTRREVTKHELVLRDVALGYPESHEDFPWEHRAIKVRKKVFLFLGTNEEGGLSLSVKLPDSNREALLLPFASPTGYGLGKSGWVSASFARRETPPIPILREWIDESYRAVAPKKLVALLSAGAGDTEPPERPAGRKAGRKKVRKKA